MSYRWISNNSIDCIRVSTSEFTESGIMHSGPVCFCGMIILTDEDITVNIYDNTEASGKKILPSDGTICGCDQYQIISGPPIYCDNGIYLETTGTPKIKLLYDGAW